MKKNFFLLSLVSLSCFAVPKAVVFDFGGVMVGLPEPEVVSCFIQDSLNISQLEFERAKKEKRLAIQSGKTEAEFWVIYARENNKNLSLNWQESFQKMRQREAGADLKMYALVDALKEQNIVIAMLSNMDTQFARFFRKFDLYKPFDPCLFSQEIGAEKPDLKAYEILLQTLNLRGEEVVFVDDLIENVEASKELGIDGILFESAEQLQKELKRRGIEF